MRNIVYVLVTIFTLSAHAFDLSAMDESTGRTDISVRYGQWSRHHADHDKKYLNETHRQVGIKYGEYTAYKFDNSKRDRSWYVGKDELYNWHWLNERMLIHFRYGYSWGILHGYKIEDNRRWTPIILPIIALDYERFGVDITIVPEVVTALNFRFKLN